MQSSIVATVLVAAVAHAAWNLASKFKRGDTLLFVWAYCCASALWCVPIGIAFLVEGQQTLDWRLAVGVGVSAALHIAYSMVLQIGYDRAELGVVYPVARGTGPMLTMMAAICLLGERPTTVAMLGAFLVIAGILVVIGNPFRSSTDRPVIGVLWGTATGSTIASYTLWDSYSVSMLHLEPVSYYAGTLLLQSLVMTPVALRRWQQIKTTMRLDAKPILIVAVFSPLAYILVLCAMQRAPVALVAPMRESSIVIGAVLACWLFGESHLHRRIVGAIVVVAGIAAISH